MMLRVGVPVLALLFPLALFAEEPVVATIPVDTNAGESTITPTWETQRQARTFRLDIPAPRGQITDRNGKPLAISRIAYNLSLNFPTPLNLKDPAVLSFARQQIGMAERLLGRKIEIKDDLLLKHYRNRGLLPLDLALDLTEDEIKIAKVQLPTSMELRATYQRVYPAGRIAGPIVGYVGKTGRQADGPLQNGDLLWPDVEGREGLEASFNEQLTGRNGELRLTYDQNGTKTSERITRQAVPGYNVITSLDLDIQKLCEDVLAKNVKRGAIVIMDANTGDVLALASWPCYDPNVFIPNIDVKAFQKLQDDPNIPLLPRAFRSSYPPGSTFKVVTSVAALESGTIRPDTYVPCPPTYSLGSLVFRNWKKSDAGSLDVVGALIQSCNTFFYEVGIRTGGKTIVEYARKLGLGFRTGIPLNGEVAGRIPDNEYMQKVYKRNQLNGDVANISIGQGDVQITPLQMAQAMTGVASGGNVYQARLVQQVQTLNNEIVTGYGVRIRNSLNFKPDTAKALKEGLVGVVNSGGGTAGRARLSNIVVAGKTGTAQWGPKKKERTAAWFVGYAPADKPQYTFAALVEGDIGSRIHGGTEAAPLIGQVLKAMFKNDKDKKKAEKEEAEAQAAPDQHDESD